MVFHRLWHNVREFSSAYLSAVTLNRYKQSTIVTACNSNRRAESYDVIGYLFSGFYSTERPPLMDSMPFALPWPATIIYPAMAQ